MKVLLDTNFLTLPYRNKIDIFTAVKELIGNAEFVTLDSTTEELDSISDKAGAKLALQLLKNFNVKVEKGDDKNTDRAIIRYALREKAIVCTNDAALKKECLKNNIQIIFMRKKKVLCSKGGR